MKNRAFKVLVILFLLPATGSAAMGDEGISDLATRPVPLIIALASLSLLPFVIMSATSYVKISVVLNILRHALGAQQVPPASVVSAVAVVLTIYVMMPTIDKCRQVAGPLLEARSNENLFSRQNAAKIIDTLNAVKEPIREFLRHNSSTAAVSLFHRLAHGRISGDGKTKQPAAANDLIVLFPSFLITELQEAFFIGFLIFLPFLVIELVVSNILLSLGMHMLNPTIISLPFKLLLFVSVSGWEILSQGLVIGYR